MTECTLIALLAFWMSHPVAAQVPLTQIGAAAAVRGAVMARPPDAAVGRVVESGKPLYLNDHVTTDASGRLQVLLLDETVFTLGPSSDMVLDEFVYDPKTSAGKVSAQVTKGLFRFVTGKVARRNPESMKVKLPVATIGIRGTEAMGRVEADRAMVMLKSGAISVQNDKGRTFLDKPDFATIITAGSAPSKAFLVTADVRDELNADLGAVALSPHTLGEGLAQAAQLVPQPGSRFYSVASLTGVDPGLIIDLLNSDATFRNRLFPEGQDSNWDDMRLLDGTGQISGSGAFTGGALCNGGPANCSGVWGYTLDVDYTNMQIAMTGHITTPNISDNHSETIDYSDPAQWTGSANASAYIMTGGCLDPSLPCHYDFQFKNHAGFPGASVAGSVTYNDGVDSGSGGPVTSQVNVR